MTDAPVVLDTSALLDAIDANHPEHMDVVTRLLGERGAVAPTLLVYEAGNVVQWKLPHAFGEDAAERAVVLEVLLEGIELVPLDDGMRARSGRLVAGRGITFYDAAFLALAETKDATALLTQDQELSRVGKEVLGEDRCLTLDEAAERW